MTAAKLGISNAGHNISNAATEGYSRQRVHYQAAVYTNNADSGKIDSGSGVLPTKIDRVHDEFVEDQIQASKTKLAFHSEYDQAASRIEGIFSELSSPGINHSLGAFFNAWQMLANEPQSIAVRQSVLEQAKSLTEDFRQISKALQEVRRYLDIRIETTVDDLNHDLRAIADFSSQIELIKSNPQAAPNDLLDRRDLALEQIREKAAMKHYLDDRGHLNISLQNGGNIMAGVYYDQLQAVRTARDDQGKPDNSVDIFSTLMPGSKLTHKITGGKLGALLHMRDQVLSGAQSDLDQLATQITQQVNQIHSSGYDLGSTTNLNFFTPLDDSLIPSQDFSVSLEIQEKPDLLAAAALPNSPGDNTQALAIAHLASAQVPFFSGGLGQNEPFLASFDDWYNSLISRIGTLTAENANEMMHQQDIMTQLQKIRESISGVSVDEETTHLMQFQQIFGACARMIQLADELLQTVLSIARR
jgi:flagellar hook-associated protein 1 FlgK